MCVLIYFRKIPFVLRRETKKPKVVFDTKEFRKDTTLTMNQTENCFFFSDVQLFNATRPHHSHPLTHPVTVSPTDPKLSRCRMQFPPTRETSNRRAFFAKNVVITGKIKSSGKAGRFYGNQPDLLYHTTTRPHTHQPRQTLNGAK